MSVLGFGCWCCTCGCGGGGVFVLFVRFLFVFADVVVVVVVSEDGGGCDVGIFVDVVFGVVLGSCVSDCVSLLVMCVLGFFGLAGSAPSPSDVAGLAESDSCVGDGMCAAVFEGGEGCGSVAGLGLGGGLLCWVFP